ncbi:MAG: hypothetical protein ACR2PM_13550 [Hyphomicrobiales bacterium]
MGAGRARSSALDTRAARLVALGVFALCVLVLGYIHRQDLFPPEAAVETALNPEFVKCRDERAATVDKMLADKVIDERQHEQFRERAVSVCADRFPPNMAPAQ